MLWFSYSCLLKYHKLIKLNNLIFIKIQEIMFYDKPIHNNTYDLTVTNKTYDCYNIGDPTFQNIYRLRRILAIRYYLSTLLK